MRSDASKSWVITLLTILTPTLLQAQSQADSLIRSLVKRPISMPEKVAELRKIADSFYAIKDEPKGDLCINQMILVAEESRDPELARIAYFENPAFLLESSQTHAAAGHKEVFVKRALDYARRLSDPALTALANIQLSTLHLNKGNLEQASYYADIANTNALTSANDTAIILSFIQQGNVNKAMAKSLVALQKYSNAQDLASDLNIPWLESRVWHAKAQFYKDMGKKNIGREEIFKSLEQNRKNGDARGLMLDQMMLAKLCESNDPACEVRYLQMACAIADSLGDANTRMECKRLTFFTRYGQWSGAEIIRWLEEDKELKTYLVNLGPGALSWTYGQAYLYQPGEKGRDSAVYFLRLAKDSIYTDYIMRWKKAFVSELAQAEAAVDMDAGIAAYQNLLNLHQQTDDMAGMARVSRVLIALYEKKGDFQSAYRQNKIFDEYQNQLSEQTRLNEVDLLTMENDRKEKQRLEALAQETKRRFYNLQYMIIGVVIITMFVGLAMMGMYKVSQKTIRMMGFFSFLLLFEFITLVYKKWVTQYTKGIPWQDLLFMIALAVVMLPLHHWLEHRIIHYLTSRNLLKGHGHGKPAHGVAEKKSPSDHIREGEDIIRQSLK